MVYHTGRTILCDEERERGISCVGKRVADGRTFSDTREVLCHISFFVLRTERTERTFYELSTDLLVYQRGNGAFDDGECWTQADDDCIDC